MENTIIFKSSKNFNAVYSIPNSSGGQSCTREVEAGVYKVLKLNRSSIVISKFFPINRRDPDFKVYCRVSLNNINMDSKGNYVLVGSDPINQEDLSISFPEDLVMPNNYKSNQKSHTKSVKEVTYGFKGEDKSDLNETIYVESSRRMKVTVGISPTNSISKELMPGKYAIKDISRSIITLCLTHVCKTFTGDYKSNVKLQKMNYELTPSGNYKQIIR